MMNVLVACEYSGKVRDAFIKRGHNAISCDLLPCESPINEGCHYQGDVLDMLTWGWDLIIAHPPCTYLSVSGLHWNKRGVMVDGVPREQLTVQALSFVEALMKAECDRICIENPISCISTRLDARQYGFSSQKATQVVQPYDYGHDASKATCLWLKGLPPLQALPSDHVPGRTVGTSKRGQPVLRWANQTDSGQNKLPPTADRWKHRSETYQGIADAMASQWG